MPIPVFPEEIWNFNIKRSFKKGGLFHRDQYKYEIDPTKFTSKIYYFDPATVTFGKWDIANESLVRYISIYEEDSGDDVTETSTESFTHVQSSNFKGDISTSNEGGGHLGGGHRLGGGGHFGNRSPSLSGYRSWGNYQGNNGTNPSNSKYVVHEYNTGSIRFGIDVR